MKFVCPQRLQNCCDYVTIFKMKVLLRFFYELNMIFASVHQSSASLTNIEHFCECHWICWSLAKTFNLESMYVSINERKKGRIAKAKHSIYKCFMVKNPNRISSMPSYSWKNNSLKLTNSVSVKFFKKKCW